MNPPISASASMSMASASMSMSALPPEAPSGHGPFSKTALAIIIPVAVVSLLVAGLLSIFGDDLAPTQSSGADGYSRSAIGHRGFVDLMRALDIPVVVSRGDSAEKARDGVLVIAEPSAPDQPSRERLKKLVADGQRVLLVLPKWYGHSERGEDWVDDVDLIPTDELKDVLAAAGLPNLEISRHEEPVPWTSGTGSLPTLREPQLLVLTDDTPVLPVVASSRSSLVSRLEATPGKQLWILSDPDVLNNYGLRDPENSRFMIELVEDLRGNGPVVLDETMHGNAQTPSLVRTLFRFPLVLATLQVLICAVLALWAAAVRFGPKKASPPPIAPGKDFLIRNTAALLRYGGHHVHAIERYLAVAIRDVRHALHAPDARSTEQSTQWLERVRAQRHCDISLPDLQDAVIRAKDDKPEQLVELADRIYRWRQEMTRHGSGNRT